MRDRQTMLSRHFPIENYIQRAPNKKCQTESTRQKVPDREYQKESAKQRALDMECPTESSKERMPYKKEQDIKH